MLNSVDHVAACRITVSWTSLDPTPSCRFSLRWWCSQFHGPPSLNGYWLAITEEEKGISCYVQAVRPRVSCYHVQSAPCGVGPAHWWHPSPALCCKSVVQHFYLYLDSDCWSVLILLYPKCGLCDFSHVAVEDRCASRPQFTMIGWRQAVCTCGKASPPTATVCLNKE